MRPFLLLPLLLCTACATVPLATNAGIPPGRVLGGNQPVAGATIQLYAVSTTADAGPATPLLDKPQITDRNGYFSIYGHFTCADPAALTYITATGGNPGLGSGAANPDLALMAAIGRCDTAATPNPIQINEVTSIAAVSALGPFMASAVAIGSSPQNAPSLTYSFYQASELARIDRGASPGLNVPAADQVPFVVINSLANTLSACVNSPGGVAGDASRCGQLFALTGSHGDTLAALQALAARPAQNTVALFNLAPATGRFEPALTLPPLDFSIGVTHAVSIQLSPAAGLTFPTQVVATTSAAQSVFIANTGTTAIPVVSIGVAGVNSNDFAVSGDCLATYAPVSGCTVRVVFSPIATGRRSAYLQVHTTGTPSDPAAVPLLGTGS